MRPGFVQSRDILDEKIAEIGGAAWRCAGPVDHLGKAGANRGAEEGRIVHAARMSG